MDFLFGFDSKKLKPNLKMAVHRIDITKNKKVAHIKHQKRDIAKQLENGQDEKARIKVEHIIREDFTIEAFDIIALLCDLVHERVKYMCSMKECPDDLVEAVSSLIWCAERVDIPELSEVKRQLIKKYGKEFAERAEDNDSNVVNGRLFNKLKLQPPSAFMIQKYLEDIARENNVQWTPTSLGLPEELSQPIAAPMGFSVPMAPGSELRSAYQRSEVMRGGEPEFLPPPSYDDSVKGSIPAVPVHPVHPFNDQMNLPNNRNNNNNNNNNDFQGGGGGGGGGGGELHIPLPPTTFQNNNNNNNGGIVAPVPAPAPAPAPADDSFEALQARFNALRNG